MQSITKQIKTVICLATFASFVSCTPARASTDNSTSQERMCATLSETAGAAMQGNQSGTPLVKMMEALNKVESDNTKLRDLMKSFLLEAYGYPRFNTKSFQDKAVVDFSNKKYLECMKHSFGLIE